METSFFHSLIAQQPCEEMSYKVQRPLPTALGAALRDELAGSAWQGACAVLWSLWPGCLDPILCWLCAGALPTLSEC